MKTTVQHSLSTAMLALGLSTSAQAQLLLTEYVEGSSNNKAIEITNRSAQPVELAGYALNLYYNGKDYSRHSQALTGELAAGKSLVVYHQRAAAQFKNITPLDLASPVANFNGDDALTLTFNDIVIDSFGQVGTDPGSSWSGSNGFKTKDKTLRRLDYVATGDSVATDAFPGAVMQWQVFDKNTADGLGCDGIINCDEAPALTSPLIFSEYIEGSGNNKAIEIANTSNTTVKLAGYEVALYTNGKTQSDLRLALTGELAAQSTLVIYNQHAHDNFKINGGIASNVTSFNGDDTLLLTLNDKIIDSIGQFGVDPGSSWSQGSVNTKDKTLRRHPEVVTGDNNADDAFPGNTAQQWIVLNKDTSDGLGCIGISACTEQSNNNDNQTESSEPEFDANVCTNCPSIEPIITMANYNELDYYTHALSASDSNLRHAINRDISAVHKQLTYSEVWTVVTYSDQDPNDSTKVIELYSGRAIGKGLNAGNIGNSGDAWNREHVWAKSHGFPDRAQLAYTDAHHLRPADASINSQRSNLDFDNGGTPLTEAPANAKDHDSFEPRDEVKGDVARMLFYMDVRYAGAAADNTPDIRLVDYVGTANGTPELGKLCTLYRWHQADPVSDWERQRNNVVYQYQGNRNPFIDRPEWVEKVFAGACNN